MNVEWEWDETRKFAILVGIPWFLRYLQENFPTLNLYSVSTDWISSRQYVVKARGINGDLIVHWREEPMMMVH